MTTQGEVMRKSDIRDLLEDYREDGREHLRRQQIIWRFLDGINAQVKRHRDVAAEVAVKNVLCAADRRDISPTLALEALQQLCREHDVEFSEAADQLLVDKLNDGPYFAPLDLRLDTQDGVI